MDDAFVENDFVSLGFFDHFQGFGVCAPFDHVWIVHRDGLCSSRGSVSLSMPLALRRSSSIGFVRAR